MTTTRAILQVFENWVKAKIDFVEACEEIINKPQNIKILQNVGLMELLKPLLLDLVPKIQQCACLTLSRLANCNAILAEAMINEGIVIQLVLSFKEAYRLNRKATTTVMQAISKHSAPFAQAIVDQGGVDLLILVLKELDPVVKEIAANTLGNIAHHNPQLAQVTVDAGVIESFVPLIQDSDLQLKRTTLCSLSNITKHTAELSKKAVEAGVIPLIVPFATHEDKKLKQQVCAVLNTIAKHSADLAKFVVASDIFPKVYLLLKDSDPMVRRNSALVICEVCKHAPILATYIFDTGGVPALVDNISEVHNHERLPGIMALGYIASYSEFLSEKVISSNALHPLVDALSHEAEDHIRGASAWSLGQIGKYTSTSAKAVAEVGTMPHLLRYINSRSSTEDLKTKCENSIKSLVNRLTYYPALDCLLQGSWMPENILQDILAQIAKLVVHDKELRTKLVLSGSFGRIQELQFGATDETKDLIEKINQMYPKEILHFYSAEKYRVFECKKDPAFTLRDPAFGIGYCTSL